MLAEPFFKLKSIPPFVPQLPRGISLDICEHGFGSQASKMMDKFDYLAHLDNRDFGPRTTVCNGTRTTQLLLRSVIDVARTSEHAAS